MKPARQAGKSTRTRGYLRFPLDAVLAAPSHIAVFRALRNIAAGVTGREIGGLAGLSPKGAHDALRRLEALRLIARLPAGRAFVFHLNRDHHVVRRLILPMLDAEREYRKRLFQALHARLVGRALGGVLFGSAARGDDTPDSDIDLLLIAASRPKKDRVREIASNLAEELYGSLGLRLSPLVLSLDELKKDYGKNHPLIRNIGREGIAVFGSGIADLLDDKTNQAKQSRSGSGARLRP